MGKIRETETAGIFLCRSRQVKVNACSAPGRLGRYSGLVALDEFPRRLQVGLRRRAGGVVFENGVAEAGRFAKPDGTGDDRLVQHFGEVLPHLLDHLPGKVGAAVVHGHQDAFMPDVGIGSAGANLRGHVQNLGKAFQPEPFALEGGEHFVAGGQGGSHQHGVPLSYCASTKSL